MPTPDRPALARRRTSLVDALDASLQRGVAVRGEVVLSIADVDLVAIDLRALLASVDAVGRTDPAQQRPLVEVSDAAAG